MIARFVAFFALALALLVPRLASAQERVHRYEIDVWPDDSADSAKFRVRFEYLAPSSAPKKTGFKYFGKDPVEHWSVTDEHDKGVQYTPSKEASSGEERLDFSVPAPLTPGGPQVVVVEMNQSIPVVCGFTSCSANISWAEKFKIPVDSMVVRVHGTRARATDTFHCSGDGEASECARQTDGTESLSIPLRKEWRYIDEVGAVAFLLVLGFGIGVLVASLRARRARVLQLRGIIPPAPEPAYPTVGYRAPAIIPVAAKTEPVLAPEDAADHRGRTRTAIVLLTLSLVVFAVGVRARIPMTITMTIATVLVFGFAALYARLEKGGTWLMLAPLFTALVSSVASPLIGLVGIAVGVFGHLISIAPPGTFQGSGSSGSSSCGGGGGGGGCGGGGGGGGGGCGG